MLNLISKIGIQSQTNTENVVVLDNVMEGLDGAATFGYSVTPRSVKFDDAQTLDIVEDHVLDVRVLRVSDADLEKLQVMAGNQEPVKATGYGPDGALLFFDPAEMVRVPQFDQVVTDRILVTRATALGYQGAAPDTRQAVIGSRDLLEVFDTSDGSATVLNGFNGATQLTESQTGGSQTLTRSQNGASTVLETDPFLFPFPGATLRASAVVTASSGSGLIGIVAYDNTGSVLSASTTAIGGTGSVVSDLLLPSSTAFVRYYIRPGTVLNDEITFNSPKLIVLS